jgi:hypothetical protein
MRMRIASFLGLIVSAFISAAAFPQAASSGASAASDSRDPCPGATAFIEKEERRAAMRPQAELPPTQPGLSRELKKMMMRDQDARKRWISDPHAANNSSSCSQGRPCVPATRPAST